MEPPQPPPAKNWRPIVYIAVGLTIWGLFLALGAYLQWGADEPQRDTRKFWIVLGCVAGFLSFWALALWFRETRTPK